MSGCRRWVARPCDMQKWFSDLTLVMQDRLKPDRHCGQLGSVHVVGGRRATSRISLAGI